MSARSLSNISAVILLVLGTIVGGVRHNALSKQREAEEISHWRLTYNIDLKTGSSGDRSEQTLAVALPFETAHAEIEF
jgi:hypothetical protein